MPRIALIHATPVAVDPIAAAFRSLWPAAEAYNLLDDSLAADLEAAGALDAAMTERFRRLARYAADQGADGILFTCSAFGTCIEAAARDLAPLPVLKPNEAMFAEALETGARVGMVATFEPSVPSMEAEFHDLARTRRPGATIATACAPDALTALKAGDDAEHNRLVAEAAAGIADVDVLLLAQFSTAQAASAVRAAIDLPVLTSPDSAVRRLKYGIQEGAPA